MATLEQTSTTDAPIGLDEVELLKPNSKRVRATSFIVAVIALVIFAAFHQVLGYDFVMWDDNIHVLSNHHFDIVNLHTLGFFWRHSFQNLYIPLSYMLFGVLANASRLPHGAHFASESGSVYNPHVFHAASLIFHVANVVLVFFLLRKLVKKDVPSAIGALLFGLHPFQVESVAWISELRGLLGSFFILSALVAYVDYFKATINHERSVKRILFYGLVVVFALLALLSKPSAVVLAPVAFVIATGLLKRPLRATLIEVLPIALLAIPFVMITHHDQPMTSGETVAVWKRFFVAGDALSFYIGRFLVPFPLTIDYGRKPSFVLGHWWGFVTWTLPVALGLLVWRLRARAPYLPATSLIALFALLPVLGFAPFVFQNYSTVADRYAYLALLGPAFAVAYFLANATKPALLKASYAILAVVGIAWIGLTAHASQFWRGSIVLYRHAIAANPDSSSMRDNMATLLIAQHKPVEAIRYLRDAVLNHPDEPAGHKEMGDALYMLHDVKDAIDEYKIVGILKPDDPFAFFNLGVLYRGEGDLPDAISAFNQSLAINPDFNQSASNLGSIYFGQKEYAKAIHAYVSVLLRDSNHSDLWTDLGVTLAADGRATEAKTALTTALGIDPNDKKAAATLASVNAYLLQHPPG